MRKFFVSAALTLAGALVIAAGASGERADQRRPAEEPVSGNFSLILMVHTLASVPEFNVPATAPWDGTATTGKTYSYRSIPCTGNAPVNNISSDLPSYNTRVKGSRAPSSLRAHPFEFEIAQATVKKRLKPKRRGAKPRFRIQRFWELRGRLTLTVCKLAPGPTPNPDPVPDATKPKINVDIRARFVRTGPESVVWRGTFKLAGGTGRYADLTGSGTIGGYFFCFAAEGCAAKGAYQDGQFAMQGSFRDPTPQLDTP